MYKRNKYFIVREVLSKNPQTRAWEVSVLYAPFVWNTADGMRPAYTREKIDFFKKFKKV